MLLSYLRGGGQLDVKKFDFKLGRSKKATKSIHRIWTLHAYVREFLFLNGQPMKAVDAYVKIYGMSKQTIHIVDDYISPKTLHLLQGAKDGVSVTVISDNRGNYLKSSDCADFKAEFPNVSLTFIQSKGVSHDRFIVLDYGTNDERAFHCGASSKDAGNRATAITEFLDGHIKSAIDSLLGTMLENPVLTLN